MMGRFRFRLQRVYDLTRERLKNQQLVAGEAAGRESEGRRVLEEIQTVYQAFLDDLRRQQQGGVDAGLLAEFQEMAGMIASGKDEQARRLEALTLAAREEKERLLGLSQAAKVFEKLKKRRVEEFVNDLERKTQRDLDELVLTAFQRKTLE